MLEDEKKEIPWGNLILGLFGGVIGIVCVELRVLELLSPVEIALGLGFTFLSFCISVVIHELGHLITGLATGYRFLSFRVGTFTLCSSKEPIEEEEDENGQASQDPEKEISPTEEGSSQENPEEANAFWSKLEEEAVAEIQSASQSMTETDSSHDSVAVAEKLDDEVSEETLAARKAMREMMGVPDEEQEGFIPEETEEEEDEQEEEDPVTYKRTLSIKKYKVPGTMGQCLLIPPNFKNPHNVPFKAYLLGGGVANLISIPFACIFLFLFPAQWGYVLVFSIVALLLALSNLLPLKVDGLPNDGYNIQLAERDPHSHAALVYQLRIAAALVDGVSIGDMPEEWFYAKFPLSERMTTNPLIANLWAYTGDRFLIHGELFQAKIIYEALAHAKGLMPLLRQQGVYAFLFTMISEGRVEQVKIYPIPKKMQKKMKSFEKMFPFYAAYRYAYGKLVRESGKIMKEANRNFEKTAKNYPMIGEIEDLRVLMERLDDVVILR